MHTHTQVQCVELSGPPSFSGSCLAGIHHQKSSAGFGWTSGLQMDRSVSVSVGVVFGLTLPPRSSGMEDESPLRLGSTPGTHTHALPNRCLNEAVRNIKVTYSKNRRHFGSSLLFIQHI